MRNMKYAYFIGLLSDTMDYPSLEEHKSPLRFPFCVCLFLARLDFSQHREMPIFTRRLAFHPGIALNCRNKLRQEQFIREEPADRGKMIHLTEKGRIVARVLKALAAKIAEYQEE